MEKQKIVKLFVEDNDYKKYVMGWNTRSKTIAKYVKIDGVVDEYTSSDSYDDYTVVKNLADLCNHSIVINTLMEVHPVTAQKKLDKYDFLSVDIFAIKKYSSIPISFDFCNDFIEVYIDRKEEFEKLPLYMVEEESRKQYDNVLSFKKNLDLKEMWYFSDKRKFQYFEDFLNLSPTDEVFVDVGGFDGSNTIEFIKRCPSYSYIYYLEPDPTSMRISRERLAKCNNISFIEAGAGYKNTTMSFSTNSSSSKVSTSGNIKIDIKKIDDICQNSIHPITFIKMDIEGSESDAIRGATNVILRDHPRLAICVYHKSDDFVEIPKLIFSIRKDYTIYFRHYTEGTIETVMFFIPQKHK